MDLEATFGLQPFTRQLAIASGLTAWDWRKVRPHLISLSEGVFIQRAAGDARTRHCQRVAGRLLTKQNHFAVGMSAVALLGLPDPPFHNWDDQVPQIGAKKTRTARGVQRNEAVPIPTPWGHCSDAVTTAIHLARELALPEALMITDAVARMLAGTEDRHTLASEECRREVRRALTENHDLPALALANPAADSPAESFCRGHMIEYGLPEPACGTPKIDAKGRQRYIDLLLGHFAIEVDGEEKYNHPTAAAEEKEREHGLRLAHGLWFHRVWVKDLYADPTSVIATMAEEEAEVRMMRRRSG